MAADVAGCWECRVSTRWAWSPAVPRRAVPQHVVEGVAGCAHPRAWRPAAGYRTSEAGELRPGSSRHIMINHHDDPINKFSTRWSCNVHGGSDRRPPDPESPQETLFRPVISFVIALVDLLNGMDSKPGEFRLAHDYRIDLREALEKPTIFRPHWNSAISSNRPYAVANRTGPSGD